MRTTLVLAAIAAWIVGCDKTVGDTAAGGPDCNITISQTFPPDGARSVYYRSTIEFTLTGADATATVLSDTPGSQTLAEDGLTVLFTADEGFAPSSTHSIGLEYCGGSPEIVFSTSEYGADLAVTAADLVGQVWSFDLMDARHPAGEGLTEVLGSLLDRALLMSVVEADNGALWVRMGVAESSGHVQDPCFRTLDLSEAIELDGPDFSYATNRLAFGAYAIDVELMGVAASGTLAADGTTVGGFSLQTQVDVREVTGMLGISSLKDDFCAMAENIGTPCVACDSDGTENCVVLQADQMYGVDGGTAGLDEILEADAFPQCK